MRQADGSIQVSKRASPEAVAQAINRKRYTPFYCEENIYWLLNDLLDDKNSANNREEIAHYAVFISNPAKQVMLWRQKASGRPDVDDLVCWDYHVIAVSFRLLKSEYDRHASTARSECMIYDLDTTLLPFPCPADLYAKEALRKLPDCFPSRIFRVITASTFLRHFASDRSHMLRQDGKTYRAPQPPYPCIASRCNGLETNTLPRYLSMASSRTSRDDVHVKWLFDTKKHSKPDYELHDGGRFMRSSSQCDDDDYPFGIVLSENLFRNFMELE